MEVDEEYLVNVANCAAAADTVYVLVSGRWKKRGVKAIWTDVAAQMASIKRAECDAGTDYNHVCYEELCYSQLTGGSVDVLVRFDDTRPAAIASPEHDAILRLYLGQRDRRSWHLSGNVVGFTELIDFTAPMADPTRSLFAHFVMLRISKLAIAAHGTVLGSAERRAMFAPLLQLVNTDLLTSVDQQAREQMAAVVHDLIDRAT